MRRGRAAKQDDPEFDLASDVEDDELVTWLERPGQSMAWQVLQGKNTKKLTKYLPPGNLVSLYQHYVATRQLLGAHISSSKSKLFCKLIALSFTSNNMLAHIQAQVQHVCPGVPRALARCPQV